MSSRDTKDAPEDTIAAEHEAALARLPTGPEADEVLRRFLELKAKDPVRPLPITVLEDAAEEIAEKKRRDEQFARGKVRDTKPRPIGKAVVGAALGRATDPRLEAEFVSRNTKPIPLRPAVRGTAGEPAQEDTIASARPRSPRPLWPVLVVAILVGGVALVVGLKFSAGSSPPTAPTASAPSTTSPTDAPLVRPTSASTTPSSITSVAPPPAVSATASVSTSASATVPMTTAAVSQRPAVVPPPSATTVPTTQPSTPGTAVVPTTTASSGWDSFGHQ